MTFVIKVMTLSIFFIQITTQLPEFIELGSVVRQGPFANLDRKTLLNFTYENKPRRLVVNYNTINVGHSDFTKVVYNAPLPFVAKGCLPTIVMRPNRKISLFVAKHLKENPNKTIVIIFNRNDISNYVIDSLEYDKKHLIVAFFNENEISQRFVDRGFIVIVNLVKKPLYAYKSYWSYLFVYDLVRNDVPMLANLVTIERTGSYPWCDDGYQMTMMTHSFVGEIFGNAFKDKPEIINEANTTLKFEDHYGSHYDTPNHFSEVDIFADNLQKEYSFAPCLKVQQSPNPVDRFKMKKAEFVKWENTAGMKIPENAFVFAQTGQGKFWNSPRDYLFAGDNKNQMQYTEVSLEAIKWLIQERNVLGVGFDTLGPDVGDPSFYTNGFPVHVNMLDAKKIIIENVANLEAFPNAEGVQIDKSGEALKFLPIGHCLLVSLRMENGTGVPYGLFAHFQKNSAPKEISTLKIRLTIALTGLLTPRFAYIIT